MVMYYFVTFDFDMVVKEKFDVVTLVITLSKY